MKAAYVGILTPGSTSRMRAEWLRKLTPDWQWDWLDTDVPLTNTARVAQSLAYRFQIGPAVDAINASVSRWIGDRSLDLAWIDKAVFLRPSTMRALRTRSTRLIHFTPDTAFHANKSRHFNATLGSFDLLVTTKSFEVAEYDRRGARDKVFLTTQGFDPLVHYPRQETGERSHEVAFVGLAEPSREEFVANILDKGISVRLAGAGWQSFVRARQDDSLLHFEGDALFGDSYSELLSKCWIGLGLLSKRFPELHTTRTFEIPACGAVLATERNSETTKFFDDDEALFFDDVSDVAEKAGRLFASSTDTELAGIAAKGRARVLKDRRDYPSILSGILADPRVR
jgi:spore maturation protein CgeB